MGTNPHPVPTLSISRKIHALVVTYKFHPCRNYLLNFRQNQNKQTPQTLANPKFPRTSNYNKHTTLKYNKPSTYVHRINEANIPHYLQNNPTTLPKSNTHPPSLQIPNTTAIITANIPLTQTKPFFLFSTQNKAF